MPGMLSFMRYLKLRASWTVCSLPCRETLPGSLLAGIESEHGKLDLSAAPTGCTQPACDSFPAEDLCGCRHSRHRDSEVGGEGPEVVSGLLTLADGQVLTHHVSTLGAAFTRLLAPSSPSVHAFWVLSGREH